MALSLPARMLNTPHGNLAQGVPLKPYDGIVSWLTVRTQIYKLHLFLTDQLR